MGEGEVVPALGIIASVLSRRCKGAGAKFKTFRNADKTLMIEDERDSWLRCYGVDGIA